MNLYEIDSMIMNCIDIETGEIIDEAQLEALTMERDKKLENVALWIKNLSADITALKTEEQNLAARRRSAEAKQESLKRYLSGALAGEKFSTARVAISWRKSESVQIDDLTQIPDEYLKYAEPTANKTDIKKALKAGIELPGCQLVTSQNMQVK